MPKDSRLHRLVSRRAARRVDDATTSSELNIVPFLDIVLNLVMGMLLMTASVANATELDVQVPRTIAGRPGARAPDLDLHVILERDGIVVGTSRGFLGPDCAEPHAARGVSVQRTPSGAHDWHALGACLSSVKAAFPSEHHLVLTADPSTPYEHIIAAMDVCRGRDDAPRFPDISLAAGLR